MVRKASPRQRNYRALLGARRPRATRSSSRSKMLTTTVGSTSSTLERQPPRIRFRRPFPRPTRTPQSSTNSTNAPLTRKQHHRSILTLPRRPHVESIYSIRTDHTRRFRQGAQSQDRGALRWSHVGCPGQHSLPRPRQCASQTQYLSPDSGRCGRPS